MDETPAPVQETAAEQTADQPTDTPPSGNTEKLLPQSEVNRLIANARREGRESATKAQKPAPAPQPAVAQPAAAPAVTGNDAITQMQARLEEMDMRLKFTPLAIKAGLDDSQAEDMFDLFKLQRPQDPAGWLTDKAQRFGIGRKPETATTPPPTAQAQTTATAATAPALKPNISDRGTASPSDLRDFEGVLNSRPLEMNGHDVESLLLKHGEHKGYQMFQEHVLRALGKVRIKPPRG